MNLGKAFKITAVCIISGLGGFLLVCSCLFLYLSPKLPSIDELKDTRWQIPLRVTSQDLKIISEFGEKKRSPIDFDEIPTLMIDAILAAEDDSFFDHNGVVVSGLMRGVVQLATEGRIRSGGSTITMQVARNFFLSKRQEFTRKFNEILLTFRIEKALTKQEILSLYVNKIFLGNRAYGFAAASHVYYGKPLSELRLAQIAMVAGLPKAPSSYNPLANPERATIRRNWILGRMYNLGRISEGAYRAAVLEVDNATLHRSQSELDAAYAAEMVRQQVIAKFGLKAYTEGYTAITTIDSSTQASAVSAVQSGIRAYDKRHGYRGAELKNIDPTTWQETLRKTLIIGLLQPAIITSVHDDRLILLKKNGESAILNWADGLDSLRLFKTVNARSPLIDSAASIFETGDLIRIEEHENGRVTLAQIPLIQSAMVALDPFNGAIRALVGGFDYRQSTFNRATQATRQPGSNFKPFIYTTALKNGFTTASIINDAPVVFEDAKLEDTWRPENDGGKFYGPTRLREALYRSRNLVSIRLLRRMGVDRTLESLQSFGFNTSNMPSDLSVALGSHALKPIDIATGYAMFANDGFRVNSHILDRVIDRNGNVIFQAQPELACDPCKPENIRDNQLPQTSNNLSNDTVEQQLEQLFSNIEQNSRSEGDMYSWEKVKQSLTLEPTAISTPAERVIDQQTAFLMDSMLKDVILRGTGRKAKVLNRSDIAGKTGTTNGPRDAWFSGYSPDLVATAWVGFDDNSVLGRNEYGGSAALPIWIQFMGEALSEKSITIKRQPKGIVMVKIDAKTGKRVLPNQQGIYEFFKSENVPAAPDDENSSTESEQPLPDDLF
ncbi:MAG: PBP1A family penicillin-binding protein [Porticoccaceae bacterium]|nr:PBP1A family penicillin-binding protein [Porticoccaceae bacterium]MBT6027629.1 PBP1A family penicillin-binding protein [Porticoccaceae bacterium]MBT6422675.1 PBP1A family penicillin-binding protein [Porticoccaceae bacterium]MBT6799000.1 PBP1A family penicillin-binding protein [Porticoccaceae bacterium]